MNRRNLILLAVVIIVILGPILLLLLLSSKPSVELDPALKEIGTATPFQLHVAAPHGIRRVTASVEQNGNVYAIYQVKHPSTYLGFLGRHEPPSDLRFTAGTKNVAGLKDGPAQLAIAVTSNDFRSSTATVNRDIKIDTRPPALETDGDQHYINQGGSEMVLLYPSGYWTEAGVRVGKYTFRSFNLPEGAKGRFAFFAYPWDLDPSTAPVAFARNPAGGEATAEFVYKLFPKHFRTRDLTIDDAFLRKVVNQIEPDGSGDLITRFLRINGEMRRANNKTLADLRFKTAEKFLWDGAFIQQPGSQVESQFADVRSYIYKGKKVDQQVHLGFDLAVTQHAPVEASNDGQVVYAQKLGIYGNCVVIDHGYGLQSIYGHLSHIGVNAGDMVKKGQVIGHSGSTGLAGGDHLHFSLQLDGVQVNPVEWWDAHWIHDHVLRRIAQP